MARVFSEDQYEILQISTRKIWDKLQRQRTPSVSKLSWKLLT